MHLRYGCENPLLYSSPPIKVNLLARSLIALASLGSCGRVLSFKNASSSSFQLEEMVPIKTSSLMVSTSRRPWLNKVMHQLFRGVNELANLAS
ncbi:UNVERIFIED_CONTAM: hypothetical protein Sangu_3021500 [Sesamum angustifolium]|uniref:Uncharacterized protein n=1 Tax=Sesamum angustifolium TaxID=2727405 RepID=A0AAW2KNP8_9LAMI